ncbi:hemolysin family protein [Terrimonas ferruginea]|jgi:putative hemolysin|uniref:hemolysin family protein n=1 Tax=Terrimonas ferruginea TaxID=249 RepID=UPI00041753E3|nr:hemolysin family protein [Terrimonas ferruginea]
MEILILAGLILLNGLFSMAEIALVSARKSRLESQANRGDKKAAEALKLAHKPETFLSTVQMGITVIGIMTGIYSGEKITDDFAAFLHKWPALAPYSKGIATTMVVIIVTYFTIIFGELVPKRLGLSKPEGIAKFVAGPMRVLSQITHPFIWLLSKSSNLIVRIFSLKPNDNQVTEEEIKAIISEGTEQGTIEETEQEIIERVFHLSDRNITSLMTHRSDIIWFNLNDSEETIKEKITSEPHSIYPICDNNIDNIKGVVSIKDLYVSPDNALFRDLMRPALFVPENNTAFQVMEKFKESQLHSCFIVDEYGSILGMITLNDILEAIIGEMPQPNIPDYEIVEREDGSFLVDAQIPFYDFLTRFEKTEYMNEGEQEFDTLGGFILHELERIPHTGDRVDWHGFAIEIVDMDGHRIDKILVKISPQIREEMEE